ncbi:ABC transporter substrate-binding protein [Paenibacillus eucommiae]|uniref:Iron complex transport system substrate-binding protein n=1 Tax=Paenibacillus eucommiae TaxID=1355755 RepID=A0ABS4ISG2_9BACL|nr:ABC transporter substrate-binding protein [Paenibacillus eucommiae]MBP1990507.1 iron complex transport system substrate-binding protein [Paenibacillus eucommiae]
MLLRKRNQLLLVALSLVLLMSLLAACGDSSKDAGKDNGSTNAESSEGNSPKETVQPVEEKKEPTERKLTDPLGHEVVVPANPQRIIASYLEDHLLAIGVKPAAQWAISDAPMLYLQSELAGIPFIPWDLPFETVTSYDPDLIIIGDESLLVDDRYNSYAKIAPTYALGNAVNNDWRQALLKVGEVLGKSDEAQKALDTYNAKLAEAKEKLKAASDKPPSVAAIWLVSKTFWVVSETVSSGAVMYQDLGLAVPEKVKAISSGEGGNWKSISMEALAELDADHIFLVNSDKTTGSEALKDPIWQTIPAVKKGNVHEYGPDSSWLYTGAIANSQIIDDVLESLVK